MDIRPKLKPILQERVVKERRQEKEQELLRHKYNLPEKKYIEIRKEHMLTAIRKIVGRIIRLVALTILFFLAFVGTVAILYPDARSALLTVYQDVILQLNVFLSV